jgi:predicted Rossmann fold nucleotide-binding protein DprA/Smf involved in DNA uptake
MAEAIAPDAQAVLLLCGHFAKAATGADKPLSVAEYGRLAKWLHEQQLRPADLLKFAHVDFKRLVEAKLDAERVLNLLRRGAAMALATEKWLRSGLWVLSRSDPAYPKRFKERLRMDAPPLLYGAGEAKLLDSGGLAIVGSRNASEAALEFTRSVAARCGEEGIAVVSGGARGVDSTAMQASGHAGAKVIGVLADGLLQAVRNRENRLGLEDRRLVLVSPFYPEAGFNAGNAMARNRYIYALADYALVIESDLNKGGTWAGAVEDLRDRWVPLFVRREATAAGNAALITRGALPFDFDLDGSESLHAYLEGNAGRVDKSELFKAPTRQPVVAGEESAEYFQVDGKAAAESKPSSSQAPPEALPIELDLYQEFLRRLVALLSSGALPQREIAARLGITTAQAKAWLGRAHGDGHIQMRGKTKKYSLPEHELFQ